MRSLFKSTPRRRAEYGPSAQGGRPETLRAEFSVSTWTVHVEVSLSRNAPSSSYALPAHDQSRAPPPGARSLPTAQRTRRPRGAPLQTARAGQSATWPCTDKSANLSSTTGEGRAGHVNSPQTFGTD